MTFSRSRARVAVDLAARDLHQHAVVALARHHRVGDALDRIVDAAPQHLEHLLHAALAHLGLPALGERELERPPSLARRRRARRGRCAQLAHLVGVRPAGGLDDQLAVRRRASRRAATPSSRAAATSALAQELELVLRRRRRASRRAPSGCRPGGRGRGGARVGDQRARLRASARGSSSPPRSSQEEQDRGRPPPAAAQAPSRRRLLRLLVLLGLARRSTSRAITLTRTRSPVRADLEREHVVGECRPPCRAGRRSSPRRRPCRCALISVSCSRCRLLLRADQQEVEDQEDQQHRDQHAERRRRAAAGAWSTRPRRGSSARPRSGRAWCRGRTPPGSRR